MALIRLRLRSAPQAWPEVCACCGDAWNAKLPPQRGFLRRQSSELVPYCRPCAEHVQRWQAGQEQAARIGGGGWLLGVVIYGATRSPAGSVVFALSLPVALIAASRARAAARNAIGPRCAGARPAIAQIVGGFGFTSETYAVAFARANREALLAAPADVRAQLGLPRAVVVQRTDRDEPPT